MLGRNLMIIGSYDRARVEFQFAARLKPESPEIRYNLGKVFSAQDNFPEARAAFGEAIRLNPDYMEAHNALGFALESMGEDPEALEHYHKAIALNDARGGNFTAPYVNLGAYYNRVNQPEQALERAEKALAIDADSHMAYFQQAKALRALKRWTEAVEVLEKAVALNARISRYHYVLGLLYRRLGDGEKSRRSLDLFMQLEDEATALESKWRAAKGLSRK